MSSENISFEETSDLANNNDYEAQYNIGLAYEVGIGVKKDPEQAYFWYLKSAEGDFPKAQYSLGLCLALGKGCDQNKTLSKQWIKKAHENGYTFGGTF